MAAVSRAPGAVAVFVRQPSKKQLQSQQSAPLGALPAPAPSASSAGPLSPLKPRLVRGDSAANVHAGLQAFGSPRGSNGNGNGNSENASPKKQRHAAVPLSPAVMSVETKHLSAANDQENVHTPLTPHTPAMHGTPTATAHGSARKPKTASAVLFTSPQKGMKVTAGTVAVAAAGLLASPPARRTAAVTPSSRSRAATGAASASASASAVVTPVMVTPKQRRGTAGSAAAGSSRALAAALAAAVSRESPALEPVTPTPASAADPTDELLRGIDIAVDDDLTVVSAPAAAVAVIDPSTPLLPAGDASADSQLLMPMPLPLPATEGVAVLHQPNDLLSASPAPSAPATPAPATPAAPPVTPATIATPAPAEPITPPDQLIRSVTAPPPTIEPAAGPGALQLHPDVAFAPDVSLSLEQAAAQASALAAPIHTAAPTTAGPAYKHPLQSPPPIAVLTGVRKSVVQSPAPAAYAHPTPDAGVAETAEPAVVVVPADATTGAPAALPGSSFVTPQKRVSFVIVADAKHCEQSDVVLAGIKHPLQSPPACVVVPVPLHVAAAYPAATNTGALPFEPQTPTPFASASASASAAALAANAAAVAGASPKHALQSPMPMAPVLVSTCAPVRVQQPQFAAAAAAADATASPGPAHVMSAKHPFQSPAPVTVLSLLASSSSASTAAADTAAAAAEPKNALQSPAPPTFTAQSSAAVGGDKHPFQSPLPLARPFPSLPVAARRGSQDAAAPTPAPAPAAAPASIVAPAAPPSNGGWLSQCFSCTASH